jgi:hypothetical protein
MGKTFSTHWENSNAYKVLMGKPEGERMVTPRLTLESNIKMDLREIGWGRMD